MIHLSFLQKRPVLKKLYETSDLDYYSIAVAAMTTGLFPDTKLLARPAVSALCFAPLGPGLHVEGYTCYEEAQPRLLAPGDETVCSCDAGSSQCLLPTEQMALVTAAGSN